MEKINFFVESAFKFGSNLQIVDIKVESYLTNIRSRPVSVVQTLCQNLRFIRLHNANFGVDSLIRIVANNMLL